MADIILDTSVIVPSPKVLASVPDGDKYIILGSVLTELAHSSPQFIPLVHQASSQGRVILLESNRSRGADTDIIGHAQALKQAGKDVLVATQDREISNAVKAFDVPVLTAADLVHRGHRDTSAASVKLTELAEALAKAQKRALWSSIVTGVASAALNETKRPLSAGPSRIGHASKRGTSPTCYRCFS